MNVRKNSGELVPFDGASLKRSLDRSGASKNQVDAVFEDVCAHLYEGISTRELYEFAFESLRTHRNVFAARYSLKRALKDLGPEGFYFEKWVGKLFQSYGYETTTGKTLQGKAVTHEIDVVALKDGALNLIECKFRNDESAKISVTTPMYFMSRMKDLSEQSFDFFGQHLKPKKGWLITNAFLTSDSVKFIETYEMNALSWDYPEKYGLKHRTDDRGLYPITCLTTLNHLQKEQLLKADCILVQELVKQPNILTKLNVHPQDRRNVLEECMELLKGISSHK